MSASRLQGVIRFQHRLLYRREAYFSRAGRRLHKPLARDCRRQRRDAYRHCERLEPLALVEDIIRFFVLVTVIKQVESWTR
jgi:hypothetical protein